MVSDQEPRYRLVDADGNIVGSLYGKPDGSVAIQETDSGADREVTLAPDGTFSAPSVETESVSTEVAEINGVPVELVATEPVDDTESVTFSQPDERGERWFIYFDVVISGGPTPVEMTFNGDDATGNGNYGYWDETGTKYNGIDAIEIIDAESAARVVGPVAVAEASGLNRTGIDNRILGVRPEAINGFAQKGGWNLNEQLSSITITASGSGNFGGEAIELWRSLL